MKKGYEDGIIIANEEISPNIYEVTLDGDFKGKPGQFYMVRGWNGLDPLLPRPISISNLIEGKITFLYEVRGRGTHIISKLKEGDKLRVLGPLGNGFDYGTNKRIAIVSGGIGIAPMLYLAKNLKSNIDLYAGFRSESYYLDSFSADVKNIHVSTEDGSEGYKGYIVDLLQAEEYDLVYTCGPVPMMKAVIEKCKGKVPVYLSMESRMACGVGACLGCGIETTNGIERVCVEGPVFSAEEVVFHD